MKHKSFPQNKEWYNAVPSTHMRKVWRHNIVDDCSFSKTKPTYNIQQSKYTYIYITDNYRKSKPHPYLNQRVYTNDYIA